MKVQKVTYNFTRNSSVSRIKENQSIQSYTGSFSLYTGVKPLTEPEKLRFQADMYPDDNVYRKSLLINSGKNPEYYYRIRSIIGSNELQDIMYVYNNDESKYSTGENFQNLLSNDFRSNIHIHTLASDGFYDIETLLKETAEYADRVADDNRGEYFRKKEPFVIAVTDHDTTEAASKAIDIIYNNPMKYKNLRVVLGSEMTTLVNDEHSKVFHMLNYNIDPIEEVYKSFIDDTKAKKNMLLEEMIGYANQTWGNFFGPQARIFSAEEAKNLYNPLDKNINGIYNHVKSYLAIKLLMKAQVEPVLKIPADKLMADLSDYLKSIQMENKARKAPEIISEYLKNVYHIDSFEFQDLDAYENVAKYLKQFKCSHYKKIKYLPCISDVNEALKNQPNAIVGIAHPLDYVKHETDEEKKVFLTDLYNNFKKEGGDRAVFSEAYYQSYPESLNEVKKQEDFIQFFDDISTELNLYKTGSLDTHRTTFYKRY